MATYVMTFSVEVDDADLPIGVDGSVMSAEDAVGQVMEFGPTTVANMPEYLLHRFVVATDVRLLHPHPEDLQRRIVALEERVATLEGR